MAAAPASTSSIRIAAPPERILDVIADFPSYPRWAAVVKSTEVLSTGPDGRPEQVRFRIDAGAVQDDYVLAYSWSPRRVDWHLVRGQMQKSQEGSYVLQPAGGDTEVTYSLTVDLVMPMLGMFKRKAEKVILDTALKELKKQAELPG